MHILVTADEVSNDRQGYRYGVRVRDGTVFDPNTTQVRTASGYLAPPCIMRAPCVHTPLAHATLSPRRAAKPSCHACSCTQIEARLCNAANHVPCSSTTCCSSPVMCHCGIPVHCMGTGNWVGIEMVHGIGAVDMSGGWAGWVKIRLGVWNVIVSRCDCTYQSAHACCTTLSWIYNQ